MKDAAPRGGAGAPPPVDLTLDPREELLPLMRRLVRREGVTLVEFMLQGHFIRARVDATGRHVAAKRLGIHWLVWVDGREMERYGGGQLRHGVERALRAADAARAEVEVCDDLV